jgi:hypothetical protein
VIYLYAERKDEVRWQDEIGYSAWNVYEGDLDVLRSDGTYSQLPGSNDLAARTCGATDVWIPDTAPPPQGKSKFALVTGVQNGTESSLGSDSHGNPRPNANACP